MGQNKGSLADQLRAKLALPEDYTPEDIVFQGEDNSTKKVEIIPHSTIVVRKETKGRGGKQVTVIEGFEDNPEYQIAIEELSKELKVKCGCGGSAKDGLIILQGDVREKIVNILLEKKYNAKRGN